ncbi:hypothetical protein Psi02_17350 [Planotetraspora silvatica]|uniref:Uncharacterized protein n=1 Tax=Planotetraspora silvatica TaxID=234614 RepID=A0A8J3UIW5_9ACTN|nr:hypothetical protein Psi02_17350 [Planotetraspora silvatica]
MRKQPVSQEPEMDSRTGAMEEGRVKILIMAVNQNPSCFDAKARATASVLSRQPSGDQRDAAVCELTGVRFEECPISVD